MTDESTDQSARVDHQTGPVMSVTADVNNELFHNAPPLRIERALGLIKPGRPHVVKRALLAALIAWAPLAIVSIVELFTFQNDRSFFSDFGVHARFLVALPVLILAEADCTPRLGRIANHFYEGGFIVGADTARFEAAVSSTRRLLNSTIGEVVTVLLGYLVVVALVLYVPIEIVPAWHSRESATGLRLTPAGWWHAIVSVPLLLIVFFGWLWRLILWARFLFLMSRLNLHLIPGHPDRAGGLKFVSSSLRGFRLISFALGSIVAGPIANGEVHRGKQPLDFKTLVIGLLVFLLVLFAAPLTIFLKKLREAKKFGVFEYGALAGAVGAQFEAKWLQQKISATSLEAPDFSATTDLYSVTANAYAMREVPFTIKDLIGPIVIAAMVPLIPVALLAMPMRVIVQGLAKLLF